MFSSYLSPYNSSYYEEEDLSEQYEELCPHNHNSNRDHIKELIEALYSDDKELNTEFIAEKLFFLAQDYGIEFNDLQPLLIQKKPPKKIIEHDFFQQAVNLTKMQAI